MCDETKERARERRGPKNTPRGLRAEMMMQETGTEEGCREGKEAGERKEGWRRSEKREGEEGNASPLQRGNHPVQNIHGGTQPETVKLEQFFLWQISFLYHIYHIINCFKNTFPSPPVPSSY